MTHLLLWFLQIALGALVATACFYLVKAPFVLLRFVGWLLGLYFIFRYVQGCVISVRMVFDGSWVKLITAGINIFLMLTTAACLLRARWIRKGYIADTP